MNPIRAREKLLESRKHAHVVATDCFHIPSKASTDDCLRLVINQLILLINQKNAYPKDVVTCYFQYDLVKIL